MVVAVSIVPGDGNIRMVYNHSNLLGVCCERTHLSTQSAKFDAPSYRTAAQFSFHFCHHYKHWEAGGGPPATKDSPVTLLICPTPALTISTGRSKGRGEEDNGGKDSPATDDSDPEAGDNRQDLREPPEASSPAKHSLALSISEDRLSWELDLGKHEGWQPKATEGRPGEGRRTK